MRTLMTNYRLVRASLFASLLTVSCLHSVTYGQMGSGGGGMAPGGMAPGGMGGPGRGGGGMGGLGMGVIGGSGMPGGMSMQPPDPLVIWEKPQGDAPQWLVTGNNALQANESLRRSLEFKSDCDFVEIPLQQAIAELLDKTNVSYSINKQELESAGHAPDIAVSLSGRGPTRELLRRLLSPLDLGYIVREDYIEITSFDAVQGEPVLRTYDLAHVMPNNQGVKELLLCIQTTIEPHMWEQGETTLSTLGSLLVVRAPENVHHEISKLLVIRSLAPQAQEQAGGMAPGIMGGGDMNALPGLPPPNSQQNPIDPNAPRADTTTPNGSISPLQLPSSTFSPSTTPTSSLGGEGAGTDPFGQPPKDK
jgi:hypothetical protein